MATFSHEIVPHYLRTKPEPEVESKHAAFENRATNLTQDSLAKMLAVTKMLIWTFTIISFAVLAYH